MSSGETVYSLTRVRAINFHKLLTQLCRLKQYSSPFINTFTRFGMAIEAPFF